jgi:ligand-binding SRPBCC domain-containing protein
MRFIAESVIHTTPERLFAFHELPDALSRLMPPSEHARVIQLPRSLRPGERAIVAVRIAPFVWIETESVHTAYDPPWLFEDQQVRGAFGSWHHRHIITADPNGARLRDEIDFTPPLGPLGRLAAPLVILPRLRKMFAYRHEVTRAWCEAG